MQKKNAKVSYIKKLYYIADLYDLLHNSGISTDFLPSVAFDYPPEPKINELKTKYPFLPENYVNFLNVHNGCIIGDFMLYGLDDESSFQISCIMELISNSGEKVEISQNVYPIGWIGEYPICISLSGEILMIKSKDDSFEKIADTFDSFMNDCVFGDRYNDFSDDTEIYDYLISVDEDLRKKESHLDSDIKFQRQRPEDVTINKELSLQVYEQTKNMPEGTKISKIIVERLNDD